MNINDLVCEDLRNTLYHLHDAHRENSSRLKLNQNVSVLQQNAANSTNTSNNPATSNPDTVKKSTIQPMN